MIHYFINDVKQTGDKIKTFLVGESQISVIAKLNKTYNPFDITTLNPKFEFNNSVVDSFKGRKFDLIILDGSIDNTLLYKHLKLSRDLSSNQTVIVIYPFKIVNYLEVIGNATDKLNFYTIRMVTIENNETIVWGTFI